MNPNKPHAHEFIQKVDIHDQLRWHECVICKQWEECNCTEEEFEKNIDLAIRFSNGLMSEAEVYLEEKMGSKPSRELTNDFLISVARLGRLFLKNAEEIEKDA